MVFTVHYADGSSEVVHADCMEDVYVDFAESENGSELVDVECDGFED